MTFKELKEKAKGLKTSIDEDTTALKYELFLSVFKNLYEDKLMYEEKGRCYLIKAENIKISPEYLEATAVIIENLYKLYYLPDFDKTWRFGFNWGFTSIASDNSFYFPYASTVFGQKKKLFNTLKNLLQKTEKMKSTIFYIKTKMPENQ